MRSYTPFISGKFIDWQGDTIPSINPATGLVWSHIAKCDTSEADVAIRDADLAFRAGPWAQLDPPGRADMLEAMADMLEERWEELVEPEILDNGKRIAEVRGQLSGLHCWYRHFAAEARKLAPVPQSNSTPGVTSEGHWSPYGVVVAITPWNSPLMILAWKLAPALAAGNTVVVKPSEMASASTLEFTRLVCEAGLPPGVLNVVTGWGHEVGEALVRHPLTRKVSFTGSDIGGRKVAQAAAGQVVPTTLELGGKSPQVVFADCDLDSAINGVMSGIFLSNGQTCVAGSRLIVEARIKDAMISRLLERSRSLKPGDPFDPNTQIAPLANEPHLRKVTAMIEQAKADGANCLLDGTQTVKGIGGYYVGPTIFDQVSPDMQIWREEVFGPVLSIATFESEDEAIALANDSDYGLSAGVWTTDAAKAARVAEAICAGTVYINHYRSVDPGSPIGGVKLSGYGRELGPGAITDFLQVKSIWTGTTPVSNPFL
ncbi:aldehyde dehydrogenase family protein [Ruegeria conchae]|uniref:Aldehyde dehydrogenase (NAD+) n=1 Tax=Ruegeria conchae TaxID=981384 RepID=A0A497ZP53_9RHOB|nr:aldehyde dehydrogenase family protein [Ruegeria conchae]RLK07564.1 aldehyde dehydrogenase (NAD+) [Ruegeria conchae]